MLPSLPDGHVAPDWLGSALYLGWHVLRPSHGTRQDWPLYNFTTKKKNMNEFLNKVKMYGKTICIRDAPAENNDDIYTDYNYYNNYNCYDNDEYDNDDVSNNNRYEYEKHLALYNRNKMNNIPENENMKKINSKSKGKSQHNKEKNSIDDEIDIENYEEEIEQNNDDDLNNINNDEDDEQINQNFFNDSLKIFIQHKPIGEMCNFVNMKYIHISFNMYKVYEGKKKLILSTYTNNEKSDSLQKDDGKGNVKYKDIEKGNVKYKDIEKGNVKYKDIEKGNVKYKDIEKGKVKYKDIENVNVKDNDKEDGTKCVGKIEYNITLDKNENFKYIIDLIFLHLNYNRCYYIYIPKRLLVIL
ncbi:hypothetical protein PFLG_01233 [Plasmodium falciparum RAJ116]|uniref:Uncharacterized protein n=1 Tax=Plasmodium falciparum RAJ116 TaxID=580058 RepID=A0A0L0CVB4_PLAFA|nr:hypothetical protein PFLG_01233 [Plasmodium falciparum RAJ116]